MTDGDDLVTTTLGIRLLWLFC